MPRPPESNRRRGRRQHRDRPPEQSLRELWPDYLNGGYFDSGGGLRPELTGRSQSEELARSMARSRPGLTPHQARRFFQHCRMIEARLCKVRGREREEAWRRVREQVQRLDVFAADALAKRPAKIPRLFHDFIRANVEQIETCDDFLRGFLPHFEALMGFGARFLNRNRDRS